VKKQTDEFYNMLTVQRKEQKDTRLYRHLKKWLEKACYGF